MVEKPTYEELQKRIQELEQSSSAHGQGEDILQDEKYRLLVENANEVILVAQDGLIRFVNQKIFDYLGSSPKEVTGRPFIEYIHPEDREKVAERHFKRLKGKDLPNVYPFRIIDRNGNVRWIEINAVRSEWKGKPATFNYINDITDRKQAESVQVFLARTGGGTADEPFFQTLARYLAHSLDMDFVCIDRLEGDGLNARTVAVWCDGHFEDNVTYALKDTPCGEVVGKAVCCFPASVSQFFPRDQVLQDLQAESYVGVTLFSHIGQPIGLIAVISRRPLTNRPQAEAILQTVGLRTAAELERLDAKEALQESEARFKALHNASFGGIAIHDKGLILDCNRGLSEMSGYSVDELIGMDGLLLIAEKSRPAVMNNILSAYEKPYEATGLRKNGEEFPIRLEARNIPYKGKQVRTVEFRDITEQKKAEMEREKLQAQLTQAQKMESVGRLAGGVAHDFNNMLGVILGHAEFALEEAAENHDLYADLKEIQTAAQRSADLTKQLLTFARKQIIDPRILDLNDTVESMLSMLRRLIGEDINLAWQPAKGLWPVKMDPSQIDQILANLCVNARDAIPGVGKLTIETGKKTFDPGYCADHAGFIPGDFVMLAVSDNGCGMDKETLNNLFEPFFTTKDVGEGTGLGLATIYGIVKQNSGFINVYSEPDQGSIFRIYLPRYAAADETPVIVHPGKPDPTGTETILLVEDEPAILRMTRMMLERKGYSVLPAATPGEAIDKAKTHAEKIDLLMTDVVMPEMNGRDVAGQLTALFPDIKLLFMSGYTANVIAHQGVLDEGMAFIQKPFSMKELAEKVRGVLDKTC